MAVTTLDAKTALIVIDLQKGIATYPVAHPLAEVLWNTCALAEAFRRRALPVMLVNVVGRPKGRAEQVRALAQMPPDFAELLPELNRQPEDHLLTKQTAGAFTGTGLEAYLKSHGVTQVVLAGVATSMGVEMTARHAFELGFNVTFAVDAMTDVDAEAHDNSIARIFPRIGETGTTRQVIALLGGVDA